MTDSIHDDLREVMGLLGKATPGELTVTWMENANTRWPVATDASRKLTIEAYSRRKDADTRAIAAAVNFLRQHGPALLARQEGEDAAKWITAWRNRFIDEKTSRLQAGASMYYEEARAHAEESANQFEAAFAEELRKRAEAARSGGGG